MVRTKKTVDVITLFPNLISPHLNELPFKRAIDKGLLTVNLHDLRNFANDKRGTVDDTPYGGGVGMILMLEPIFACLSEIYQKKSTLQSKIIVLSPKGETYTQKKAQDLVNLDQLTLISGRYEGIDSRVLELNKINNNFPEIEAISIGNYVLSGGELPSLVVMESLARLIPGVLKKPEALEVESFSKSDKSLQTSELHGSIDQNIEYPQYTRPKDFKGLKVPKVLLSGNHAEIKKWRKDKAKD